MPHCSVMSMGTPFFISKLKFSCDKYSVDQVWTKIYCHFYFRGIIKLHWIPFYEQCEIDKCSILHNRIHGSLPSYLDDHLVINHKRHSRNTRYANFNATFPKYDNKETEGGRTFAVSASRLWNNVPTRKVDSVACFKHNMWSKFFRDQKFLHHFHI